MRLPLTKKPMRTVLAAGALAIFAGGGAYLTGVFSGDKGEASADAGPPAPPPASVRIAEAVSTELSPHSDAPGSVVSVNDSLVAAATPGKVLWVADIGDEVVEGDVIARIDPADATVQRDRARADIKRLEARANFLATRVKRFESLGENGGESEATLDQMRSERDEAIQNVASAKVSLRAAQIALERTEVKAPFNGRIATRETEIGEFLQVGAPIARLVNLDALEVTARAPDALLSAVHEGDEISVTSGARSLTAKVRAIVPVGDLVSRTLELRLVLPKSDWHIGSAVQVRLPRTAPKRVIAVNRDALILRADKVSLFLINAENVASKVEVELGAADGELIEVIGAVKAGDKVVIRGGERLRDGQKVVIQDIAGNAVS